VAVLTWPGLIKYEFAFNTSATGGSVPPYWNDLSNRVQSRWSVKRGRQYELDTNTTGQWTVPLANPDGALDPSNTSSPYYPNVVPYRPCRIRVQPGVNRLTPDQATCGQATPYPTGPVPTQMGVANDFGYPVTLASSGTAYTGSRVYQVTLPSTAGANTTILLLPTVSVTPGAWYSATAEVVITSGSSVACNVELIYYASGGAQVSTTNGAAQTVTSGSTSWTTLTCSAQAPTASTWAQYAALKVEITGSVTAATTFQVGALQFEQSAIATPFQIPQAVSRNLFPQVIATGSQSMNPVSDAVANWWYQTQSGGSLAQSTFVTAPAPGQTSALAWTTPSGTTSTSGALWVGYNANNLTGPVGDCVQVVVGTAYTVSAYVSRASSADTTVAITLTINWFNSAGVSLSTVTGSATTVPVATSWARATVSGTAPAGAAWGRVSEAITTPASTTATNTIYHTAYQVEQNGSVTSWVDSGPTYQIFNGSVERWPQSWALSGTYGQANAVGVDAFALLAQGTLPPPFVAEVLAMNPTYYYQLADPAGASSAADTAGNRIPLPVETSPYGAGSLTFGSSASSASPTGGVQGTPGTVALFANPLSGSNVQEPETFLSLYKTTVSPGPPASGPWTRMLSFCATAVPGGSNVMSLWSAYPASWTSSNASSFWFQITQTGLVQINVANATNNGARYTSTTSYCDGNWHQLAVTQSTGSGAALVLYVDGVAVSTTGGYYTPTGIAADVLGAAILLGVNSYQQGYQGSLGHVIEFPFALTQAQMTDLYQSWRTASAGDSSGQRTQRVLNWIGYQGATAIETGSTTNMGPATDIGGSTAIDASTALLPGGVAFTGGSALQGVNTVAQTENGNVYVSNTGAFTFKARSDRYNQTVPMFVFGEQQSNGEWPYETVGFDFDPSHLYTEIQATQYSTSQVADVSSATAQTQYGQRVLQLTMNQALYSETQDAANYLLGRYDTARMRIASLTLHPSAMPGLWAVCLALEVGTRIRVMRRPPYPANAIQVDCFVESVAWSVDPEKGATVQLQCSPADLAMYWTLGALHTTLNAQVNSGATSATINALPDAAVNSLNSSLPQGYQLTFDPGTAIAETMTIAPPLPATNVGYTTATLNFTSAFAHTHAAGAVVCEPLPTGYTNPATWDQGSVLGASYTTFAAAATSGSSTITVGTLGDSKANALASNWNVGDLLQLSPGTPNVEGYNLFTPNQATAGAGVLPLATGTLGTVVGVSGSLGTPAVTSSGSAFQGSTVWQVSVAANAALNPLIYVMKAAVTPNLPFTGSFYVRSATTGANPQVNTYLKWYTASVGVISQTNGTAVTLTGSPTAAWTRVTLTGTAPANAAWVQAAVILSVAPTSAWTFQADGMQLEQNSSASTFATCPQIQSVAASVPGYSTVVITLANPLANNHNLGDYACDPLPAGTSSPTAVAPTTRIAY